MGVCSPHCCGLYSASGILFMLFVWAILTLQPFYVKGIEDTEIARTNVLGALITFCVTFTISAIMIMKNKQGNESEYDTSDGDFNRLNIDLKNNYGSVAVTDSY